MLLHRQTSITTTSDLTFLKTMQIKINNNQKLCLLYQKNVQIVQLKKIKILSNLDFTCLLCRYVIILLRCKYIASVDKLRLNVQL